MAKLPVHALTTKESTPPHPPTLRTRRLAGNPNVANLAEAVKLLLQVAVRGVRVQVADVDLGHVGFLGGGLLSCCWVVAWRGDAKKGGWRDESWGRRGRNKAPAPWVVLAHGRVCGVVWCACGTWRGGGGGGCGVVGCHSCMYLLFLGEKKGVDGRAERRGGRWRCTG